MAYGLWQCEGGERSQCRGHKVTLTRPTELRRWQTSAQQLAVNLVGLEMHRIAGLVLDPYLDARRLGEVKEDLGWLAFRKLLTVKINSHLSCSARSISATSTCSRFSVGA
jgi:hypothetical protein